VGSKHSSNSNRLVETARLAGTKAFLGDDFSGIPQNELRSTKTLGISSGASVPDILVEELVAQIQKQHPKAKTETLQILKENVKFGLPEI
jgi:4-hydroxy-3-methylbut-2-enyl diphosphate reductase